jgi:hypothetical protein
MTSLSINEEGEFEDDPQTMHSLEFARRRRSRAHGREPAG